MRKTLFLFAALALLTAGVAMSATAAGGPPSLPSVRHKLVTARLTRAQAEAAVRDAERRFAALDAQYGQAQAELELAVRDVDVAYLQQRALSDQLAQAQQALNDRAAAAYETGPGLAIEMFLGAQSSRDFATAQEFAAHTFSVDQRAIDEVQGAKAALAASTAVLERRQAVLRANAVRLQTLDVAMEQTLADARAVASRAGLAVKRLEQQEQAIQDARAAALAALASMIHPGDGVDQSALLALLGPTHGRGCTIPSGLQDTGNQLSGLASWYGWDFAGQHTASGAIYDPRLFTAANKELPLNSFLRVRYRDRCAVVLVNDRGPYGMGRSFDLSEAAATYLGYHDTGVVRVTADILVPRQP